ncbi:MAG: serine hydrolase [Flavobacterium sp.]|nr:serine hydrolase [Flavobacterium sp.]
MKNKITIALLFLSVTGFSQKLNTVKLDSLFDILEAKDKYMGSIAIVENGVPLYIRAIGKDDVESGKKSTIISKYRVGSISKMFTATLVFKAIEEGKLDIGQTIFSFFPDIENAKSITISNLLNHRSGIHNLTNDDEYMLYFDKPKTEAGLVQIIAKGKSDFAPDSKAAYSNSNYILLSFILQKVYKKPYKTLVEERIIKPIGLKNTYVGGKTDLKKNENFSYIFTSKWEKQPETDMSVPMGAGAIVSNPTDLTTFIKALFDGKLINEKSLATMATIRDGYGSGIFETPFFDKKGLGHTGSIDGFSSVLTYFRDDKLAVALSSNGNIYQNNNIMIAALSAYYGKSFAIPTFNTLALSSADLDQYLGVYSCPQLPFKLTVTKDNITLVIEPDGQSATPMEATAKDIFEYRQYGIKLIFKPQEKQLLLQQSGQEFVFSRK